MFRPYGKFSDGEWHVLLESLDAAIVGPHETAAFTRLLTAAGLQRVGEFASGHTAVQPGLKVPAATFGPYVLYSKIVHTLGRQCQHQP